MFLGIIIGIILTIGAAYLYDSFRKPGGPEDIAARPLVNWDVMNHIVRTLMASAQAGWSRLTGQAKER
jgi:hypothetical protein